MIDRRAFVTGALAAGPLTIIMAGSASGNPCSEVGELVRLRNAAWLETNIREGAEFASSCYYREGRQESWETTSEFLDALRKYLAECYYAGVVKDWTVYMAVEGIGIRASFPDGSQHFFSINWPYSCRVPKNLVRFPIL